MANANKTSELVACIVRIHPPAVEQDKKRLVHVQVWSADLARAEVLRTFNFDVTCIDVYRFSRATAASSTRLSAHCMEMWLTLIYQCQSIAMTRATLDARISEYDA
jgi:hypothetical protein